MENIEDHSSSSDDENGFVNKFGRFVINQFNEEEKLKNEQQKVQPILSSPNTKIIVGSPSTNSSKNINSTSTKIKSPPFQSIQQQNNQKNNQKNNQQNQQNKINRNNENTRIYSPTITIKSTPTTTKINQSKQDKNNRLCANYFDLRDALSLSKEQKQQIKECHQTEGPVSGIPPNEQQDNSDNEDSDDGSFKLRYNDIPTTYEETPSYSSAFNILQRQQQKKNNQKQQQDGGVDNHKESTILFGQEATFDPKHQDVFTTSSSEEDEEEDHQYGDHLEEIEQIDEELEAEIDEMGSASTSSIASMSSSSSLHTPVQLSGSLSFTAPTKAGETHIITELQPFNLNSPVFCRIQTTSTSNNSQQQKTIESHTTIDTVKYDDVSKSTIEVPDQPIEKSKKRLSFFKRRSSSSSSPCGSINKHNKKQPKQPPIPLISNDNNITYNDILSDEGKYSMKVISELLNKLFASKKYSTLNIFMGLALLHSYYKQVVIRNWNCVDDKTFLEEGLRYQKFCTATYGRKLYYGIMESSPVNLIKGIAGTDSLNTKVIIKHLGIDKKDIIATKWFSSKYSPGHYVAIDHKTKSVVLAIRGTFNHFDVITDLVCTSSNYSGGGAHLGMLLCSHKKMQELENILLQQLSNHPGYRLIVTGHSLGAGVASFFTFLFYDAHPEIPIHCYAYGTPCMLSHELATHDVVKKLITCFSMNNDIVSRLSFCSMFYLKEVLDAILSQSKTKIQRGFQIVSAGNGLGEKLTKKLSKILKVSPTIDLSHVEHRESGETQMYPAGNMYRIVKISKGVYVAEAVDSKSFDKIIVSTTMFTDHMPQKYEFGLASALENFGKTELTKRPPSDTTNVKGVPAGTVIDEHQLNKVNTTTTTTTPTQQESIIQQQATTTNQQRQEILSNDLANSEHLTGLLVPTSLTASYSAAAHLPDE
ncbi:hypothetical protein DFA_04525 [Cavenderia fasciculata]|uniref:sn-1-specific diacylglycerol lipase n=1 Tax=Cavenderia fasciculata TaxID=261658 RepID=F4PPU3_CACFS|nr:uncharacterized protein DFA_04525 [Cavenderia fasciculata]EGG22406.1 hypothetical protein DFA_04525 [Cavenderia fasciculata]|eukprot:XP_004360257.1 hypothetical protein DFA_04525 [Cavenderia fasciculata]